MNAIQIQNLDVVFGNNVQRTLALLDQNQDRQSILESTGDVVGVHNANLEVKQGEICVLMGLSGSGKSSLLRAVNGLNPISRGSLQVRDGEQMVDLANCDDSCLRQLRLKLISMVFQKFALMPWLSVVDNVAFGLEMQGINKTERRRQALEKLEMVGLADWRNKLPHELSGGMQQRVGLARAFAMDSDILLMDEPFSALDPLIRSQLQDELIALQSQLNKTILFVSHDLDEALKIGTNIAIMESARIIQHGAPEEIVLNPSNAYVEKFVAHTNPLNVLRGRSLMTSIDNLERLDQMLVLNHSNNTHIRTDTAGAVVAASCEGQPMAVRDWHEGESLELLDPNTLVTTSPDISMRQAIEIRYRTGQPVLLREENRVVGLLSDRDFYHALLGKHFSQQSAA